MKIVDFLVFYLTSLYDLKGGLLWESPLRRTMFIVALIITLWVWSIMEILIFVISRINIFDIPQLIGFAIIILGMSSSQILKRVYITNKRYKLITSTSYRAFELSNSLGVAICFIIIGLGFASMFGSAIIINAISIK